MKEFIELELESRLIEKDCNPYIDSEIWIFNGKYGQIEMEEEWGAKEIRITGQKIAILKLFEKFGGEYHYSTEEKYWSVMRDNAELYCGISTEKVYVGIRSANAYETNNETEVSLHGFLTKVEASDNVNGLIQSYFGSEFYEDVYQLAKQIDKFNFRKGHAV